MSGTPNEAPVPPANQEPGRDTFPARARALFLARLVLDALGLAVVLVPAWAQALGLRTAAALHAYLVLLALHTASYLAIGRRWAKPFTFATMCVDVLALTYLAIWTGGLRSPVMQGTIVYTVFFALLFPSPLAILPPLLSLPAIAKVQQLLGTQVALMDILLLVWTSVLDSLVVVTVVHLDRTREQHLRDLVQLQAQRRQEALAAERTRIAREMHDGLGSGLSSAILQLEYLLAGSGPPPREELEELRSTLQEAMDELRSAVSLMRRDLELGSTLAEYGRSWSERTHIPFQLKTPDHFPEPAPETAWCLFRIFQEALSNAARHAGPTRVEVRLAWEADGLVLEVSDDGKGFDPTVRPEGHYGLRNMEQRAEACKGRLTIVSAPGQGTTVRIWVPVE